MVAEVEVMVPVSEEGAVSAGTGSAGAPAETPVIRARGVSRFFGSLRALDGVDLAVTPGEVFGFLGPNGAGKSTLFRILIGLLTPSAGEVEVLGHELPRGAEALRPHIGYMPQRFSLYEGLSVEENLDFAGEIFGLSPSDRRRRKGEVLSEYGLESRRKQIAGTLSGGLKQRLSLAAAVIHEPELLVLDEPTAGVDPEERRNLWEELFELAGRETTILVSTHYMDEAMRCHRLVLLKQGRRVLEGAPTELTEALAGRVVEIRAEPPDRAVRALRGVPFVASVTQLGDEVHVLLHEGGPDALEAVPDLVAHLKKGGFRVSAIHPSGPNLEDVFVAATLEDGRSV